MIQTVHFVRQDKLAQGRNFFRSLHVPRKRACFNCRSEAHLVKKFFPTIHFSKAVASRVRQLHQLKSLYVVHVVLAHIHVELDHPVAEIYNETDSTTEDASIFEEILVEYVSEQSDDTNTIGADYGLDIIEIFAVHADFEPTIDTFVDPGTDLGTQLTMVGRKQPEVYGGKSEMSCLFTKKAGRRNAFPILKA